jgi:hypothetical protein
MQQSVPELVTHTDLDQMLETQIHLVGSPALCVSGSPNMLDVTDVLLSVHRYCGRGRCGNLVVGR